MLGQQILLLAYRMLRRPLQTRAGRRLFLATYDVYKRFEARDVSTLAHLIAPGSTVIDVGANVGFFAMRFARWVGPRGTVIAIEPESGNAGDLRSEAVRTGLTHVECVEAAAAARTGRGHLVLNPNHPADHRLGTSGVEIDLVTIDGLMAERAWPPVSLIKIDVQGGELDVINGAVETLSRSRPALYIEVDDEALIAQGASADAVAARLETLGYAPHEIDARGRVRAVDWSAIVTRSRSGRYVDVLWLASTAASLTSASPRG